MAKLRTRASCRKDWRKISAELSLMTPDSPIGQGTELNCGSKLYIKNEFKWGYYFLLKSQTEHHFHSRVWIKLTTFFATSFDTVSKWAWYQFLMKCLLTKTAVDGPEFNSDQFNLVTLYPSHKGQFNSVRGCWGKVQVKTSPKPVRRLVTNFGRWSTVSGAPTNVELNGWDWAGWLGCLSLSAERVYMHKRHQCEWKMSWISEASVDTGSNGDCYFVFVFENR